MNREILYTVACEDGESRQVDLTRREAAQAILTHDGQDYEIRPDGDGYRLWMRQEVAGVRWHGCAVWSYCTTMADAEDDIYFQVIQRAVAGNGWGMVACTMDSYLNSLHDGEAA